MKRATTTAGSESDLTEEFRSDAPAHEEAEAIRASAAAVLTAPRAATTVVISARVITVEAAVAAMRVERLAQVA